MPTFTDLYFNPDDEQEIPPELACPPIPIGVAEGLSIPV
jgi:hypothetical protein